MIYLMTIEASWSILFSLLKMLKLNKGDYMSKELKVMLFNKYLRIKPNMTFTEFLTHELKRRNNE